jgi:hypothetical protein
MPSSGGLWLVHVVYAVAAVVLMLEGYIGVP